MPCDPWDLKEFRTFIPNQFSTYDPAFLYLVVSMSLQFHQARNLRYSFAAWSDAFIA